MYSPLRCDGVHERQTVGNYSIIYSMISISQVMCAIQWFQLFFYLLT